MKFKLNVELMKQEQYKRGWTQGDLARETGLHPVTIGNIYHRMTAQLRSVRKLSEALEIPMAKIWLHDEGEFNE